MNKVNFGVRICERCGKQYEATGVRQIVCADCKIPYQREQSLRRYYKAKAAGKKQKQWGGEFKGYNQKGTNNNAYVSGIGMYTQYKKDYCEICGAKTNLLVHHIDHDRKNNKPENLQTVCKRCHQTHHCKRDPLTGRFIKHTKV